jgi:hypothetical protein
MYGGATSPRPERSACYATRLTEMKKPRAERPGLKVRMSDAHIFSPNARQESIKNPDQEAGPGRGLRNERIAWRQFAPTGKLKPTPQRESKLLLATSCATRADLMRRCQPRPGRRPTFG